MREKYSLDGLVEKIPKVGILSTQEYGRRQLRVFSYEDREIYVLGRELPKDFLESIKETREKHLIPSQSERHYLESLIWVISNQRINYERTISFLKALHNISLKDLRDPESVYEIALNTRLRWFNENKFESALNHMEQNGGIKTVVEDYLENPHEMRRELVEKIKWIGMKTASFWYQTLRGDKDILCLDIHHLREASNLGVKDIPRDSYIGHKRRNGKTRGRFELRSISSKREYERIEKELAGLLMSSKTVEKYPEFFLNEDGTLNGSFVSSLLWWASAQVYRGLDPFQAKAFMDNGFKSPYSHRKSPAKINPKVLEDMARDVYMKGMTRSQIMSKYGISRRTFTSTMNKSIGLVVDGLEITPELRQQWIKEGISRKSGLKINEELLKGIVKETLIDYNTNVEIAQKYGVSRSLVQYLIHKAVKDSLIIDGVKITQELREKWSREMISKTTKTRMGEYTPKERSEKASYARKKQTPDIILRAAKGGGKKVQELHGEKVQRNLSKSRRYKQNICVVDGIPFQSVSEAKLGLILREFGVIQEFQEGINVHKGFADLQERLEITEEEDTSFDFGANVEPEDEYIDLDEPYKGDNGVVDFYLNESVIEFHQTIKKHKGIPNGSIKNYTKERESTLRARGFNGQVIVVDRIKGYVIYECLNRLGIEMSWDDFLPKYKDAKARAEETIKSKEEESKKQFEEESPF